MATVAETVTTNATEYLGYAPKTLTVNLAIEKFKDIRNHPYRDWEDANKKSTA